MLCWVDNLWFIVISVGLLLIQMLLEHFFAHDEYWGLMVTHFLFLNIYTFADFSWIECLMHDALFLELPCRTIIELYKLSLLENLVKFELTKALFEIVKAVSVGLLSIWDRVKVFTNATLLILLFLKLRAIF